MAMYIGAAVVLVVLVFSTLFEKTYSISSVGPATTVTQGPTFMSLYEQKSHVLTALRNAGFHRIAAFIELSNLLRALPQNATLFAPSDESIATIVFSPTFSTLLLYHFAAHQFSFPDLLVLPQGTRIGTFLPGRSILVTSGPSATRVSIDGVAVAVPDIYQDGTLCVHGVTAAFDPDRFGMSDDLSPELELPAPTRNRGPTLTPRNPEVRGSPGRTAPIDVRSERASSPTPFVSASPEEVKPERPSFSPAGLSWPTEDVSSLRQGATPAPSTGALENQQALPPESHEGRSRRPRLSPSPTALTLDHGGTLQETFSPAGTPAVVDAKIVAATPPGRAYRPAPSPRHHNRRISAPSLPPAEYERLDSGAPPPRRGRRSSNQLRSANLAPGGANVPSASDSYLQQSTAPALDPDLAPRAHGPSMHHRSRVHDAPSTSPVSASFESFSGISPSPALSASPFQSQTGSTSTSTPSPADTTRGYPSQYRAGASPFSAPSNSPATRPVPGPSYSLSTQNSPSPSPESFAVAYVAERTQSSTSPVNAADTPSNSFTAAALPRLAGGIPAPSPSSPSGHHFTPTPSALANATESTRASTPYTSAPFSPGTPPTLATAAGRELSPSSSPAARGGSSFSPYNAATEASAPALSSWRDPIA